MEQNLLEYNSLREKMIIPEYGRNVQKLVKHAKTIEDDAERQTYIERIAELMYQINPQSKNVLEYKERIWAHIFRIADYDLKVTPPNGLVIDPEDARLKPQQIAYPNLNSKHRHYGANVKKLLKKAVGMEKGEKRDVFVQLIASFMKIAYKNWNREHYVNDEVIKSDIKAMTKGEIDLGEDFELLMLHTASTPRRNTGGRSNNKGRSNNNRGKGGQNRRRNNNNNNNRRRR
jgi:hypothetical protein